MGGWYPCCCDAGTCENCSGTTPSDLDVTLSGIANDTCSDCATYNDTFTLTRTSPTSCVWQYDFAFGADCSADYITASINASGSDYVLTVYLYFQELTLTYINWTENLGTTKPTCSGWSSQSVSFNVETTSKCDGTSSTCTVTAV